MKDLTHWIRVYEIPFIENKVLKQIEKLTLGIVLTQVVATKKEVKLWLVVRSTTINARGVNSSMKMPSIIMAMKFPD